MRTPFVLICSVALVCVARGEKGQKQGATQTKTSQHTATHSSHPTSSTTQVQHAATHSQQPTINNASVQHVQAPHNVVAPTGNAAGVPREKHAAQTWQPGHPPSQGGRPQTATAVPPAAPVLTKEQQADVTAQNQGFRTAEQYRKWKETGRVETTGGVATSGAPAAKHGVTAAGSDAAGSHMGVHQFPSRHFNLPNTPLPSAQNVKFQSGSHIPECEKWRDSRYNVFRKYTATWHDANWWRSHCSRVIFVAGGWYYWHAGYWFPA